MSKKAKYSIEDRMHYYGDVPFANTLSYLRYSVWHKQGKNGLFGEIFIVRLGV